MPFKPLRKDLTETSRRCDFCPKFLTSLKAYVLEDEETGRTLYAGPVCAKNNVGSYSLTGIPDLTKFTMPNGDGENSGGGIGFSGGGSVVDPRQKALEYLLLREEKLAHVMNTSYSVLEKYYIKTKKEELTENEVRHINNIEAKAPEKLKLLNLQKCYNYLFWLNVGIEKLATEKADYLRSVRNNLINNLEISQNQKIGVNNWLVNISGVPQLK